MVAPSLCSDGWWMDLLTAQEAARVPKGRAGLGERSIREMAGTLMLWTTECYEAPTKRGCQTRGRGRQREDHYTGRCSGSERSPCSQRGGTQGRWKAKWHGADHHLEHARGQAGDQRRGPTTLLGKVDGQKSRVDLPVHTHILSPYRTPPRIRRKGPPLLAFRSQRRPRRASIRGGLWSLRHTPPRIPVLPVLKPNTWWLTVRFAAVYDLFAAD